MRADCVLRDEEAGRDLVRAEVLVEQEQHLDLAGREPTRDVLGHAAHAAAFADTLEQAPGHGARKCRFTTGDSAQELGDALGRLALEQIPGGATANRREQIFLGSGGSQHDHLSVGSCVANVRQRGQAVHTGHRQVEKNELRLRLARPLDRLLTVAGLADDVEAVLLEQRRERLASKGMIVDDEDPLGHTALIGTRGAADESRVQPARADTYRSWLLGELLLIGVLALATVALRLTDRLDGYDLPEARLVVDTAVAVVAGIVAILAGIRFLVERRTMDLLLSAGFVAAALGALAFQIAPVLGGGPLRTGDLWAGLGSGLVAGGLLAAAPFTGSRARQPRKALAAVVACVAVGLGWAWAGFRALELDVVAGQERSATLAVAYGVLALLALVAAIGFGLRFRRFGRDLDSWLALAFTLVLFADLHFVLTPSLTGTEVFQGDFLRLVAFGLLLVGVWRAIGQAEFGRAVAEERGRVAQEIHDGLAQYLFAISTHVSMLEGGAQLEKLLPRLKQAATAAQQEARFAVLALSSASGTAPFDAALRRYVEVLTADGALDVELELDRAVTLAPDEQIEIFRIVQEGLANARRHADARRAWVTIQHVAGRRVVRVRDDGVGFDDPEVEAAGQGLKSMRRRAEAIEGGFSMRSSRDGGTAIEIVLRAA